METKKEWMNREANQIVDELPTAHYTKALTIINYFCPMGQLMVAEYFRAAHRIGKLPEAMFIADKAIEKHWAFQPDETRGLLNTRKDRRYWEVLYEEVGLEVPQLFRG